MVSLMNVPTVSQLDVTVEKDIPGTLLNGRDPAELDTRIEALAI